MSFLSRQTRVCLPQQKFCCDKLMCDKRFFTTNIILTRQIRVCRDKHTFVAVKDMCFSRQTRQIMFVATHICRHKRFVVAFVSTEVLSRQAYFCHDKRHVLS